MIMKEFKSYFFAFLIIFSPILLRGDTIILEGGMIQEGLVKQLPDDPNNILFLNGSGEVKIEKSRIKKMTMEEPYISHLKVGDQLFALGDLRGALEEYKTSKDLAPDKPEIDQKIKFTEQEIEQKTRDDEKVRIKEVDQLISDTGELIKKHQFEDAEKKTQQALSMFPTDQQKAQIKNNLINLYYEWAIDKLDHVKPDSAAEMLEKVIELQPDNEKAIKKLLELWENNPAKTDKVIESYEALLKNDEKNFKLMQKIADLYLKKGEEEKSLNYFVQSYKLEGGKNDNVKETIKTLFIKLCNKASSEKQFAKAKELYSKYTELFPSEDPTPLDLYEYMDRLLKLDPKDIEGKLSLAAFAKEKKLDTQAKEIIKSVLFVEPQNQKALSLLNYYAQGDLQEAQQFFNNQQYYATKNMAKKIMENYTILKDVLEKANELMDRSDYEIKKLVRQKKEQALDLVSVGDDYYNKAMHHIELWRRTDIDKSVRVISDKWEAIKYLQRALEVWEAARLIDPSLGEITSGNLNRKISDAKTDLDRLQNPISLPMPRYGTVK